jgi:hypothetical protein
VLRQKGRERDDRNGAGQQAKLPQPVWRHVGGLGHCRGRI